MKGPKMPGQLPKGQPGPGKSAKRKARWAAALRRMPNVRGMKGDKLVPKPSSSSWGRSPAAVTRGACGCDTRRLWL
eukprot:4793890-Pyramimonas_sp.AAC.1